MSGLDPAATPPLGAHPPVPDEYYHHLARRWGVAIERIAVPGVRFHVSDTLEQFLPSPCRCVISAWRRGRSRWLVSSPRFADRARNAWRTPTDPATGWPVGLHQLMTTHADAGARCDDGWVLLIWPQTLRPVTGPLLAKRVERLDSSDARRLPDTVRARADRAHAFGRRELWAVFDMAGRRALSWLWTRPYTERVRGLGLETAEAHRNQGLAKALLSVATRDLLAEGLLPVYGVRTNNPASQRVALAVGYLPVARDFAVLERA